MVPRTAVRVQACTSGAGRVLWPAAPFGAIQGSQRGGCVWLFAARQGMEDASPAARAVDNAQAGLGWREKWEQKRLLHPKIQGESATL